MNTGIRHKFSAEDKNQMKTLYEQGYSFFDIGQKYSCQSETIRYHLKKTGIAFRSRGMQTQIARAKYSREKHHSWKGGKYLDHGYWKILMWEHPNHDNDGYIAEHRFLMEEFLKKTDPSHPALEDNYLSKQWIVHHKNGVKTDNRLENLEVMPRNQHHSWLHYHDQIKSLQFEIIKLKNILDRNKISY